MSNLTDFKIKNMTNFVSEPINSRGDGTLYLEERKDSIEAYYRYSYKGTRSRIKIGNYKINKVGLTLKQDKKYGIKINPVTNIPKQSQFERVIDRTLTHEEVKQLWEHIHDVDDISENTAYLIQFMIAIAGQRPQQLVRSGWDKYDYRLKTVLINDTKGRGGSRGYLTPLTQRALDILEKLKTGDFGLPWTNNGKVPVRVETLHKWVEKYCKQFDVEKFTPRDLRTTCKNLMIDAGVNRETRNLIQNHGLTGIDFKHYDKRDHLPEKIDGMRKYDYLLDRIITGKMAKVVHI